MARDGLFFRSTGTLNKKGVPGSALVYQGIWISGLILLPTRHVAASGAVSYGNLYSDLLDYVVFSVLIFYALTIAGIFVLRANRPNAERPYRAFGYPCIPLLYIVAAAASSPLWAWAPSSEQEFSYFPGSARTTRAPRSCFPL